MKPNYKNWVPKILIAGMAAATVISIAALTAFGICGLWVTKTWRIILAIVFAVAAIGCGKTLQEADSVKDCLTLSGSRAGNSLGAGTETICYIPFRLAYRPRQQ